MNTRPLKGEANGSAKLTSQQVIEIRRLKGSLTQQQIALQFGVTKPTVGAIHRGRLWAHLEAESVSQVPS